jgi:putative flavoprotein involved in K+ transport
VRPADPPSVRVLSLYFLGLSWQHTRGSALIGWLCDDAEFIATGSKAANENYEGALTPQAAGAMEGV